MEVPTAVKCLGPTKFLMAASSQVHSKMQFIALIIRYRYATFFEPVL